MKDILKNYWVLVFCLLIFGFIGWHIIFVDSPIFASYTSKTPQEIKLAARRASVQPIIHIPLLKVSFTSPLPEPTPVDLEKLLDEKIGDIEGKIQSLIDRDKEIEKEKYETRLTDVEVWGWRPPSQTLIPVGAIPGVPKYAKFPQRVLVVAEIKTDEEINPYSYSKDVSKDIETISETLDVSKTTAQTLITALNSKGYTVNKEVIETSSDVKLLWYDDGWDDTYPTTLDWAVEVEEGVNLITGYSNGVLEVKPVPKEGYKGIKRIHIKAGFLDLHKEHKPKPYEVLKLEGEIKRLKDDLEKARGELEQKKQSNIKTKRDISRATLFDVMAGYVRIERMWMMGGGSGVFLGNMRARQSLETFNSWMVRTQNVNRKECGVILTNAHVAEPVLTSGMFVSGDKEVMYLIFPGVPFIRYTQSSDYFGSPAYLLAIDGHPVLSNDVDTAILVTSPVPQFEPNRAILGNSDNVKQGETVVCTSNPGMFQKYTSEGVVSNTNYSMINAVGMEGILKYLSGGTYRKLINGSFWIDAPAVHGGSSGSGITALEGREKGKVVALEFAGVKQPLGIAYSSELSPVEPRFLEGGLLSDIYTDHYDDFFDGYDFKSVSYDADVMSLKDDYLNEMLEQRYHYWVKMGGMSIGIPINRVKAYLQERGLDPDHFEWDGVDRQYWEG